MYQALGGFDEAHETINNDLDFCLRAHQAGKLVVFTPHASPTHHEVISRDGCPTCSISAISRHGGRHCSRQATPISVHD
jgi:GT2 family glycosyltransferase